MSPRHRGLLLVIPAFAAISLATVVAKDSGECGCEAVQQPTDEWTTEPGAHDPVVVKEGRKYHLFVTGRGIPARSSTDLKNWGPVTQVFASPPEWAGKEIVGIKDHIWAPDVSRFGGKWHLYYSISTFGKNRSAIGHATNVTLDPGSKEYRWVDHGPVFQSYPTDDYNAIDPNVVIDDLGTPWLSFGSFWSGLQMVRLDREGKRAEGDTKPIRIAGRPHEGPQQPGAIEAPFIIRRGGHYYLFASYDFCCRGANSTYNVRVGRSKNVQGPYVDREGKALTEGGGTKVIEGGTRWKGPGHEAVLREGKTDTLVYHAYDAENRGRPMLRMAKIAWDREGWPTVPPPP